MNRLTCLRTMVRAVMMFSALSNDANGSGYGLLEAWSNIGHNIKKLRINLHVRFAELIVVRHSNDEVLSYGRCHSNVVVWRILGQAVGGSHALEELEIQNLSLLSYIDPLIAESLGAFYEGAAGNASIRRLRLGLLSSSQVPMFDLNHLVQNNTSLEHVFFCTEPAQQYLLHTDQSLAILEAVRNTGALESLEIGHFNLHDDRHILRDIISACLRVKDLTLNVVGMDLPYEAIASLLQNNQAVLTTFHCAVTGINQLPNIDQLPDIVVNSKISNIATSLRTNDKLEALHIDTFKRGDLDFTPFEHILCDPTSIESIHNSNHTLQTFTGSDCSELIQVCLTLNSNTNKQKVIHQKIARFYFKENFDVSPFLSMPTSLLPDIIGMIQGDEKTKCYAIFRLLRRIPDLSKVSDRVREKMV